MPAPADMFLGEALRALDDRFRLSLPAEWAEVLASGPALADDAGQCVLAKERPGCVSLWPVRQWKEWLDQGMEILASKMKGGRLDRQTESLQAFGRLLSTRHQQIPIAGRGRIAIPESFRSFLGVEPGGEIQVVGAAVCVELWRPDAWNAHVGEQMPQFRQLFDELTA